MPGLNELLLLWQQACETEAEMMEAARKGRWERVGPLAALRRALRVRSFEIAKRIAAARGRSFTEPADAPWVLGIEILAATQPQQRWDYDHGRAAMHH